MESLFWFIVLIVFVVQQNVLGVTGRFGGVDPRFSVDPKEIQLNEMSQSIGEISGAVMGIAEIVFEIKSDLSLVRKEIGDQKILMKSDSRDDSSNSSGSSPLKTSSSNPLEQRLLLAERLEKILRIENDEQVDLAKEEIKKTVEVNFIRVLSSMLIFRPMQTTERRDHILRLMKAVLNGQLDFEPVLRKLPFIIRDSETHQFINLMKALREEELVKKFREGDEDEDEDETTEKTIPAPTAAPAATTQQQQTAQVAAQQSQAGAVSTGTQTAAASSPAVTAAAVVAATTMKPRASGIEQVIDAVGGLNIEQLGNFLSQLPEVFLGVENIVDGVEDYLSFGDIARRQ